VRKQHVYILVSWKDVLFCVLCCLPRIVWRQFAEDRLAAICCLPRILWRQFAAFRGFFGGNLLPAEDHLTAICCLPRILWRQFAACRGFFGGNLLPAEDRLAAICCLPRILWRQIAEDRLAAICCLPTQCPDSLAAIVFRRGSLGGNDVEINKIRGFITLFLWSQFCMSSEFVFLSSC
jgi:hypothetical protein